VKKATVNYGGAHPQQGPIFYQAEAKPYIHIVSAGLTYRWDNPVETIPVAPVVRKY
jgi:long-chain fatty acid transport protein